MGVSPLNWWVELVLDIYRFGVELFLLDYCLDNGVVCLLPSFTTLFEPIIFLTILWVLTYLEQLDASRFYIGRFSVKLILTAGLTLVISCLCSTSVRMWWAATSSTDCCMLNLIWLWDMVNCCWEGCLNYPIFLGVSIKLPFSSSLAIGLRAIFVPRAEFSVISKSVLNWWSEYKIFIVSYWGLFFITFFISVDKWLFRVAILSSKMTS